MDQGGQEIVQIIDPYLLASYWYARDSRQNDFDRSVKWIKYSLSINYNATAARAFNLWGNIHAHKGNYQEAIKNYETSTKQDNRFAQAFVNWGDALRSIGEIDEAISKYKTAIRLEPRLPSAH